MMGCCQKVRIGGIELTYSRFIISLNGQAGEGGRDDGRLTLSMTVNQPDEKLSFYSQFTCAGCLWTKSAHLHSGGEITTRN